MEKRLFRIISNRTVAADTLRLDLAACEPGYEFSGEFVDIALDGFYLRRPFSVCDYAPGRISIAYKTVGAGTEFLASKKEGETLDILTGLGKGFNPDKCSQKALLVGGGLGAAPLYPLCKKLVESGKDVYAVLGFNTAADIIFKDEFKALTQNVIIATMDGSEGMKGLVTDVIAAQAPEYDFFYTCGPTVMMKAVCNSLQGKGEASLEERMGCGCGHCFGCTIQTANGPRRVCKDGPVFDKEDLIW